MKKKILTTIILIMFCTLAFCQCVKAEVEIKTTIQIKSGASRWTSISASDAYDKCQELNNDNSALGTTGDNVMAHLSTNADWYAVSLLTYSVYGSKNEQNTTGNSSGINGLDLGVFTAGILENNTAVTAKNYQSIIDNKNTKFVEILKTKRNENKPGLGFLVHERLISNGAEFYRDNYADCPISCRSRLFGFSVGLDFNNINSSGTPSAAVSFRPVIWVK